MAKSGSSDPSKFIRMVVGLPSGFSPISGAQGFGLLPNTMSCPP